MDVTSQLEGMAGTMHITTMTATIMAITVPIPITGMGDTTGAETTIGEDGMIGIDDARMEGVLEYLRITIRRMVRCHWKVDYA